MGIPRAPKGTQQAGQALWRAVVGAYQLDEHEMSLLVQACRVADTCDRLQAVIDRDGPLVSGSGGRIRPALVELRQQQIVLTRILVALRVPIGDQENVPANAGASRLQRRGARGVYAFRGGQLLHGTRVS